MGSRLGLDTCKYGFLNLYRVLVWVPICVNCTSGFLFVRPLYLRAIFFHVDKIGLLLVIRLLYGLDFCKVPVTVLFRIIRLCIDQLVDLPACSRVFCYLYVVTSRWPTNCLKGQAGHPHIHRFFFRVYSFVLKHF